MYRKATTTRQAYAYIDPQEALPNGDARFVPLDDVRGTIRVALSLADRIMAFEAAGTSAHLLLTGHGGCGKTTELFRLREELTQANYPVVYFDINEEVDLQQHDVHWWNILLGMIWQIDDQLSQSPWEIRLPAALQDEAVEWLARTVTSQKTREEAEATLESEFGADASIPFFLRAKMVLRGLITSGSSKVVEIQQEVEKRPDVFKKALEAIIVYVNRELKAKGLNQLVVIVDGLEKIPYRQIAERLSSHEALFVYGANYLKSPPCHLVYTLPLELLSSSNVIRYYPEPPVVMPMIHTHDKSGADDEQAFGRMRELINLRVEETLFDPAVPTLLARASGGHIRDFLHLFRDAALYSEEQISVEAAKQAIANLITIYNDLIRESYISTLDHVEAIKNLPGREEDGELINRLLVLDYRNHEAWKDLHPCVREAPRFKNAARAAKGTG